MPPLPTTIAALTRLAGELEDEAEGAPPEVAVKLYRRVLVLRKCVEELQGPGPRLTVKHADAKLHGVEHSEKTRRELSERFTRGKNPNMVAAREAGMPSLRALAEYLGCSASFLSQVAGGDRPMPADKAAAFKKLTGKDWQ